MSDFEGRVNILGVGISPINMDSALDRMAGCLAQRRKGYVCVTGAHGILECQKNERLRAIHNRSVLTVPDGMPTVWIGWLAGRRTMRRVYGPDLMAAFATRAAKMGASHYLFGAVPETLRRLKVRLEEVNPGIRIVGWKSPPFRPLNEAERRDLIFEVGRLKPDVFWVGLSTPKQELFMGEFFDVLDVGLMVGVGAAFDLIAGRIKDAPKWMKHSGLQWLYRLWCEPRRLWRRYSYVVPVFLAKVTMQACGMRRYALVMDWLQDDKCDEGSEPTRTNRAASGRDDVQEV